ncbi:hypothetical protein [Actinomadura sp. 9N215]|uniref:hypothetical protein n=1 Tax=Actinomadura sp. 9N215 TaxID=3375150 RepID=UPI00379FB227
MTERGPFTGMRGAPGPAEPSNSGGPPAPAGRPQAVAGLPADLSAVRRTDAIIDSLAARRAAGSTARSTAAPAAAPTAEPEGGCSSSAAADGPQGSPAEAAESSTSGAATKAERAGAESAGAENTGAEPAGAAHGRPRQADDPDPAVRLLRALITDVDDQAPGCDTGSETTALPVPPAPSGPGSGSRRRGPRTIVALGVAGAVLASTGVAAAGSGVTNHTAASPSPSTAGVAGDPEKPAASDTDAGWHRDRPRSLVRPVSERDPAPEPPARRKPSGDRGNYEPTKSRVRHLFPHQRYPRRQDRPGTPPTTAYSSPPMTAYSGPATRGTDDRPDAHDGTGHRVDDLRARAHRRINQYQYPNRRDND